jgi:hypothetical protein
MNYAGIGYTYDSERDAFIPPKELDSWVLSESTCLWEALYLTQKTGRFILGMKKQSVG